MIPGVSRSGPLQSLAVCSKNLPASAAAEFSFLFRLCLQCLPQQVISYINIIKKKRWLFISRNKTTGHCNVIAFICCDDAINFLSASLKKYGFRTGAFTGSYWD